MSRDAKLSGVLHVLLHLADAPAPMTSEQLALGLNTNPVVIRRLMAGLREADLVRSEKGHGGGWTLHRPLEQATLGDVYRALGAPPLLAFRHRNAEPQCLVEQSVNTVLDAAFQSAEELLLRRFNQVSLATIAKDFRRRMKHHRPPKGSPHAHRHPRKRAV